MNIITASLSPERKNDKTAETKKTPNAHLQRYSITIAMVRSPAKHGKVYVPIRNSPAAIIIATSKAAITEQKASLNAGLLTVFFISAARAAAVAHTVGTDHSRTDVAAGTARGVVVC